VRFWDTAALVPLLAEQAGTRATRDWLAEDAELVVWWGTHVECASAIARLERSGAFDATAAATARARLDDLRGAWFEVQPIDDVRRHAIRLLRVHALRAADALQLGAALVWSGTPAAGSFHTLDDRLAKAARIEGFEVAVVGT
jgi:uncharacterized protein